MFTPYNDPSVIVLKLVSLGAHLLSLDVDGCHTPFQYNAQVYKMYFLLFCC